MKKIVSILLVFIMLISLAANIVIATEEGSPDESTEETTSETSIRTREIIQTKAKVIEAGKSYEKQETEDLVRTLQDVKIEIIEGKYKGQVFNTVYVLTYDVDNKIVGYELVKGNKVTVEITEEGDAIQSITVVEIVRQNYIILMIVVFFAIVIAIGKKQGVKSIVGLVVTILAIYFIMIKGIYDGKNAVWLSVITSVVIIVLTFIIVAGLNKKSLTAAIGTSGGVISAGIMATLFGYLTKIAGVTEESLFLTVASKDIVFNFKDLFFAGIVVSALGACMDVGMSISSALDELKQKNPDITWKELLKSGMNIGGDVIGTMTNTLILAYVGSSLTLILLFMATNMSIGEVLNKETIVIEAVSALAGSMGVVFTVPITSLVYSLLNKDKTVYDMKAKNKVEGKRSIKI